VRLAATRRFRHVHLPAITRDSVGQTAVVGNAVQTQAASLRYQLSRRVRRALATERRAVIVVGAHTVSPFFTHYNFARRHQTLKSTHDVSTHARIGKRSVPEESQPIVGFGRARCRPWTCPRR
jgi:hypothetical protein